MVLSGVSHQPSAFLLRLCPDPDRPRIPDGQRNVLQFVQPEGLPCRVLFGVLYGIHGSGEAPVRQHNYAPSRYGGVDPRVEQRTHPGFSSCGISRATHSRGFSPVSGLPPGSSHSSLRVKDHAFTESGNSRLYLLDPTGHGRVDACERGFDHRLRPPGGLLVPEQPVDGAPTARDGGPEGTRLQELLLELRDLG